MKCEQCGAPRQHPPECGYCGSDLEQEYVGPAIDPMVRIYGRDIMNYGRDISSCYLPSTAYSISFGPSTDGIRSW